jgi:hypothetical protein
MFLNNIPLLKNHFKQKIYDEIKTNVQQDQGTKLTGERRDFFAQNSKVNSNVHGKLNENPYIPE